jgi:hypothetical protein
VDRTDPEAEGEKAGSGAKDIIVGALMLIGIGPLFMVLPARR